MPHKDFSHKRLTYGYQFCYLLWTSINWNFSRQENPWKSRNCQLKFEKRGKRFCFLFKYLKQFKLIFIFWLSWKSLFLETVETFSVSLKIWNRWTCFATLKNRIVKFIIFRQSHYYLISDAKFLMGERWKMLPTERRVLGTGLVIFGNDVRREALPKTSSISLTSHKIRLLHHF